MGERKYIRPLGDITGDLEVLLLEMVEDHDLQLGEILALVKGWTEIHAPDAIEQYVDDTTPIYLYGHADYIKDMASKLKIADEASED